MRDSTLERVAARARAALAELVRRAAEEGWEVERVEQEKDLLALSHEVSLCATPGCLSLATPVPGFSDARCDVCRGR